MNNPFEGCSWEILAQFKETALQKYTSLLGPPQNPEVSRANSSAVLFFFFLKYFKRVKRVLIKVKFHFFVLVEKS